MHILEIIGFGNILTILFMTGGWVVLAATMRAQVTSHAKSIDALWVAVSQMRQENAQLKELQVHVTYIRETISKIETKLDRQ